MVHKKQMWSKRVKKERFRKKYVSRMQATRLLQVDSMNFRRLTILKGVYPRALGRSKQKAMGNDKQYYLVKEIKWLVHDQIASKLAAFRAWEKKKAKAMAMHRFDDLKTLESESGKPNYVLDATIKERYPYFVDAVKDIDDAMSMISLYAFMSPEVKSETTIEFHHALSSGLHEKAKAVIKDWHGYVAKSKSLTRGFISIKGFYYEAMVKNQRVLWLMPHEYASKFPQGVQQYVLITFLEFYIELMRFILFKLHADLERETEQRLRDEEDNADANAANFADDAVDTTGAKPLSDEQKATKLFVKDTVTVGKVFSGLVFFISREVPRKHATFVVESMGGRVVAEFGATVTHFIIDRPAPLPPHTCVASVEYVQPQYLYDCLNTRMMLPVKGYRMSEELPAHVSPFTVSLTNEVGDNAAVEEVKKNHPRVVGYVPDRVHEIRKLKDPNYSVVDPGNKLQDWDDGSEVSENEHAMDIVDEDDAELSDDEVREARKKKQWVDEDVMERPERTKLSAFKVKKQRELNLMNKPSDDAAAARKVERAKQMANKKAGESSEKRKERKLKTAEKEDRADTKMRLQVARKKAARYYKMVSGVVDGGKKREKILASKAMQLQKGRALVADDGKTFTSKKTQARDEKAKKDPKRAAAAEKKRADPYKKLPQWVR
jgi:pescadillo protein